MPAFRAHETPEHPSFATDGALGRAKYYASVGGPGVVAAFLFESLRG